MPLLFEPEQHELIDILGQIWPHEDLHSEITAALSAIANNNEHETYIAAWTDFYSAVAEFAKHLGKSNPQNTPADATTLYHRQRILEALVKSFNQKPETSNSTYLMQQYYNFLHQGFSLCGNQDKAAVYLAKLKQIIKPGSLTALKFELKDLNNQTRELRAQSGKPGSTDITGEVTQAYKDLCNQYRKIDEQLKSMPISENSYTFAINMALLGRGYRKIGQLDDAIRCIYIAHQRHADNVMLNNYAIALIKRGSIADIDEAIDLLNGQNNFDKKNQVQNFVTPYYLATALCKRANYLIQEKQNSAAGLLLENAEDAISDAHKSIPNYRKNYQNRANTRLNLLRTYFNTLQTALPETPRQLKITSEIGANIDGRDHSVFLAKQAFFTALDPQKEVPNMTNNTDYMTPGSNLKA